MSDDLRATFGHIFSDDRDVQHDAYTRLLDLSEKPVAWAYEVWDELVAALRHKNNRVRSIASQLLSNLAKSDPEKRMLRDFPVLLSVTKDEMFVTARHCLQALWKVALAGEEQREMVVSGLESRFHESGAEKNGTLIRYDIQQDLRNIYDATGEEDVRSKALALIELEGDAKYQKKYAGVWKKG